LVASAVRHSHASLPLRAQCRAGVVVDLLVRSGGIFGWRTWLPLN
jgi:hypothetical protein